MSITGLMQVGCTRSDGATVSATITFVPATGALLTCQVMNSAAVPVDMLIERVSTGQIVHVSVPTGTRNFTPAQMTAVGITGATEVRGLSVACV